MVHLYIDLDLILAISLRYTAIEWRIFTEVKTSADKPSSHHMTRIYRATLMLRVFDIDTIVQQLKLYVTYKGHSRGCKINCAAHNFVYLVQQVFIRIPVKWMKIQVKSCVIFWEMTWFKCWIFFWTTSYHSNK